MFEWLGRQRGTKKQEPEKREAEKQKTSASVRSVLKTAVADAEQIVDSIKMKAQAEAVEEAAGIIVRAKQEAEEIKRRAETKVAKKAEDILPVENKKAEESQEEVVEEKVEAPVQLQNEAAVSEPVAVAAEESLEQHLPEERPHREETESSLPEEGSSQTTYSGEVELDISMPVDLKMVSKLYNSLQTIPELRILHTRGSVNQGTTITVVLEKPVPLINIILSRVPGINAIPELPSKDSSVKGKSNSVLGKNKEGVRRIKLALK